MDAYPRIVIGADGSPETSLAVEMGAVLGLRLKVPVTVVTVWDGFTNVPDPQSLEWARGISAAAAAVVREVGVADVTTHEPTGSAADVLIDYVDDQPESLLVIGGSSLSSPKDRVVGSVANRLSHHSPADVFFATKRLPASWGAVGLTTDGSSTSRLAVRRGLKLALAVGAAPHLVTVAKDREEGSRLMSAAIGELDLDEPGLQLEQDVLIGLLAAKTLVDNSADYDLLVIGNRGMSGPSRLLGSVANKVTHGLETNLLLVNTTRD
ncbi:universal stress protein [Antrihabitans sp. YC2-6]|uniref:universal stress protein n=1 Tax=Antrihabitans sp. YC2-6 TaxID=2799498 RepID=UPI0018F7AC06|nr:universal stress protein [Antrihabitans sp. YC2-6]MBJ8344038.1 universal stress protein [Antrihabitans sp. YC2-6]